MSHSLVKNINIYIMTTKNSITTTINNCLPFVIYSKAYLTLKRSTMKNLLLCSVFVCAIFNVQAQNATRSTFTFNYVKGLSIQEQLMLDSVYHNMSNQNYHCFNLINKKEIAAYQQSKLLRLVKARAASVITYYMNNQDVDPQNVFVKYGGQMPSLWLHKPVGRLTASGEITLDKDIQECFPFNTATGGMITSKHGTRFYFPANAFVNSEGVIVINENISICLYEFFDKKRLVFSGLTTDASGKMLESAGSFYIEASLNGIPLELSQGESYTVEMSAEKSFPDMFTYYGDTKDGIIDWTINKDEPAVKNTALIETPEEKKSEQEILPQNIYNNIRKQINNKDAIASEWDNEGIYDDEYIESERAVDFYEMSAGKLGWINCDRFYEVENKTTLAVKVDNKEPMIVRIVFKDINSVMPCYSDSNHKGHYKATGIPKGEKVLVLAYSVKDENAILGYKEVTIGENDTEFITLNHLSKTRFEGAVSELLSF